MHLERQCCVQISDAAASQQQHLAQANNATYLLKSFHKLVHDLEEPLGVSDSSDDLLILPSLCSMTHQCCALIVLLPAGCWTALVTVHNPDLHTDRITLSAIMA